MPRKFAPLPKDHPLIGDICKACDKPFKIEDEITLITLGPGDDPEEQAKARAGKAYNAVAAPVHWACSGLVEYHGYGCALDGNPKDGPCKSCDEWEAKHGG